MTVGASYSRPGQRTLAKAILVASWVFFFEALALTQSDDLQQKAAIAFKKAAQQIKQCAAEKEFGDDPDRSGIMYIGPPVNVTWDIVPNKSARAPLAAYIEFSTPRKFDLSPKGAAHFKPDYEGIMMQAAWTQKHRYEFDISASQIELIRTLRFGKTDWIDEEPNESCWQRVARQIAAERD